MTPIVRVLHFYKTYYPDSMGGVEQVIHQLAQASMAYGVQTEVLTLSHHPRAEPFIWENEHIHQVKCHLDIASTRFSTYAFKRFAALANDVDLIHYHYPWPFMDMVHFAVSPKKPTVVTYHSDVVRQKWLLKLYQPLAKRFLESVDKIIATSPGYAKSSKLLMQFEEKTAVIPIGITPFTQEIDSAQLNQWRLKCGDRFLLFVGVLRYYKGLHILLEALQGLNYPLVIVGKGPLEKELQAKASQLGLHSVQFVGAVSDLDKFALLQLCEGFIFPSHLRSEAFGVSLLEAAMMAKPMISCEMGTGTSYVNLADETGWVVKPGDVQALREALVALWEDPELAKARGLAAKRRYEHYFTAEKMAEQYSKVYQEVLSV